MAPLIYLPKCKFSKQLSFNSDIFGEKMYVAFANASLVLNNWALVDFLIVLQGGQVGTSCLLSCTTNPF